MKRQDLFAVGIALLIGTTPAMADDKPIISLQNIGSERTVSLKVFNDQNGELVVASETRTITCKAHLDYISGNIHLLTGAEDLPQTRGSTSNFDLTFGPCSQPMLDNDLDVHIRENGGVVVGRKLTKESDWETLEAQLSYQTDERALLTHILDLNKPAIADLYRSQR